MSESNKKDEETPEEILEKYKKAGKIAAECLSYGAKQIKVGNSIKEILDAVEKKIISLESKPAFPAQISLNSAAAHQCSSLDDTTELKEGDLVKIDIGTHIDGYIGDNAITVDLSENEKNKELIKASRDALNNALKKTAIGIKIRDIGKKIEQTIESYGFRPVRNLTGHGLDKFTVHTKPTMPNYDNGDESTLKKGMIVAIEPFATNGVGLIHEKGEPTVFQIISEKQTRNMIARDVLKEINTCENLPFAQRWIARKFGTNKANYGISQLLREGIIKDYPPLVEVQGGLVSQSEHTIYVDDKVIILTKEEF